jgi:proprotein convertase subtilisin/kexin type 2
MKNKSLGLLLAITLVGCGGGGDVDSPIIGGPAPAPMPAPVPPPVASNCTIGYSVTSNPILTGADPLIGTQWHLSNTGQSGGTFGEDVKAFGAWQVTKGQGVRVAVIDDAIETVHPDLTPNAVVGGSYNYLTGSNLPLPCTSDDGHGTQVTGLIVARDDNGIGVSGVAPRATFVGYNALSSSRAGDIADALGRDLQLNQISNNSWGSPDNGFKQASEASWNTAIDNGIRNGRNGNGSIYVFPAGNGGFVELANKASIKETSNFDGYANRLGVITVCATDHNGALPFFGERGANILVCAPAAASASAGGLRTTGINGAYPPDFIGTSAATPVVSGVVALMMATNPNLTWRDVPIILANSARKNLSTDADWNGTGSARFNHKFGFGVVDANAAVNLARTWTSVGGSNTLRTCGSYSASPNSAIPDAGGSLASPIVSPITSAITVSGCSISQIEYVEITFTSDDHTYSGDLRLRLSSPSGSVSELADSTVCGQNLALSDNPCRQNYNNWKFGSVRHLGENSNGAWRFEVTDMGPGDTGRFQNWTLKIYGR